MKPAHTPTNPPTTTKPARTAVYCFRAYSPCLRLPVAAHTMSGTSATSAAQTAAESRKARNEPEM